MKSRMRTGIDLSKYEDLDKLQLLVKVTSRHAQYLAANDSVREAFLDKFYFDPRFNAIYDLWIASGKNKWFYPSIDHINPKSNGGNFDLENLQFLTWFENRAKADMSQEEWDQFRLMTNTRSDLFIEAIQGGDVLS